MKKYLAVVAVFTLAAGSAGLAAPARALNNAAVAGFLHGLVGGCLVAAGVAVGGVLLVAFLLPARPLAQESEPSPGAPPAATAPGPATGS